MIVITIIVIVIIMIVIILVVVIIVMIIVTIILIIILIIGECSACLICCSVQAFVCGVKDEYAEGEHSHPHHPVWALPKIDPIKSEVVCFVTVVALSCTWYIHWGGG